MAIVSSHASSPSGEGRRTPTRRLVDPAAQSEEDAPLSAVASPSAAGGEPEIRGREDGLRPRRLEEYIGQRELKQVLAIAGGHPQPR